MKADVGPERMILSDGLQPFLLRTQTGTLFIQAQLSFPPGYTPPAENAFPGLPGNVVSRDGGKTWQRWRYTPPEDEAAARRSGTGNYWDSVTTSSEFGPVFEGSATCLRDGTVLILEWIAAGPDENGSFEGKLWASHDDLATVDGPLPWQVHLPQASAGRDDGGHPFRAICLHRTLLELPDGDLLATAYGWFHEDTVPVAYRPEMFRIRCLLLRSSDRGRSWRFIATIAVDHTVGEEGFNEPVMARVSRGAQAGRLVCLLRTGSDNCPIYQVCSDNEGETWSQPEQLPFHGVDPELIEMADGTLAGLIGRRVVDGDAGQRCYQLIASTDAGKNWGLVATWNTEPYSGVDNTTYYSSLREVAPGRLLAVYDVGVWGSPIRYIASRAIALGL